MKRRTPGNLKTGLRLSENVQLCFDCGSEMKETHRSKENGILFVWNECSGSNCDEQFLLRMPPPT